MKSVDELIHDIIRREGGYNDIKQDKGGATNLGVSLRYAKGKPQMDLDGDGDIDKNDIRLVTPEIAAELYKEDFFYGPQIDRLPVGLHAQMFDISVNAGGKRAAILLQSTLADLGYEMRMIDGDIGPVTCATAERAIAERGLKAVNNALVQKRKGFYARIIAKDPSQKKFAKGWNNRAEEFLA